MAKNLILKVGIALFVLPFISLSLSAKTPIEAFIERVKQTNNFVTVSGLWQTNNNFDKTELLKNVEDALPLTIDYHKVGAFISENKFAINLVIPAKDGGSYTIELARYDYLSNDFEVHEKGENNSDKLFNYTRGLYYSGVVKGMPGSLASFSFFKNEVFGMFSIPGEPGNYVLVPNTMVGKYHDNEHYILYNDAGMKNKEQGPGCATDRLPTQFGNMARKTTTFLNNKVYNNCTEIRVMEVADYQLYGNQSSSVTNVTNFVTALFNNQALIYRNEGIPIVLKHLQVNTTSDVYQTITSAESIRFLTKFGWSTKNVLNGCDLALLLSTRFGASLGGVAWLQSMCNSYSTSDSSGPYGFANVSNTVTNFPTFSNNIEILTHEMGHICGSPHTHKCCWNPPGTGTTAIDGCAPVESGASGSCPNPGVPGSAVGGTIMSYCHLVSSGIKFTNGFGKQPGDTIRTVIRFKSSFCGGVYIPQVALSKAGRTITANRECTDITSVDTTTYFWFDNNTADHADDTLVLAIKKHGNNIGTLDSTGFSVSTSTLAGYGGGTGQAFSFPSSITILNPNNVAFRRYWQITPKTAPTTPVTVMYPFTTTDVSDVNGSVPGTTQTKDFIFYRVNSPRDPNPANNFPSAVASDFTFYVNASAPSTSKWALSTIGTTQIASMDMSSLAGGGTGFYSYKTAALSLEDKNGKTSIQIYPNPTEAVWYVDVAESNTQALGFQLYAADGRVVWSQTLKSGINTIDAENLANGLYFYRIIGGSDTYTGNLLKK
jgi:hypothetical protein